jgi:hypothetical protein
MIRVWDRYLEEKKEALKKLAVVIDQILGSAPPAIIANQGGIR